MMSFNDNITNKKNQDSQTFELSNIQLERYNRNILIKEIGESGQKKLSKSKILVCGAGGLGSTTIANLSSMGIGTIGIIDGDVIELSNLNRQYLHKYENITKSKVQSAKAWVEDFNPDIKVNEYHTRLNETNYREIVEEYDLIMDCFDSFKSKFLLNEIAVKTGKTLIHAGVTEFFGQISTIVPGKTACLRCILPQEDAFVTKGVLSPCVSLISSVQTLEATKNILGIGENLQNKLLSINCLDLKFKTLNISKNLKCTLCKDRQHLA